MLKHSLKSLRIFAIFAIVVLLAAAMQPVIARPAETTLQLNSKPVPSSLTPATASALAMIAETRAAANQQQNNKMNVEALQNATPVANRTDTDGDGLYDPVETVLGTDINDTDTDFDRLNDSEELLIYLTDPLEPDSNYDGLSDYFEVHNISLDIDSDGFPNAWDFDNDGDGVSDTLDLSPFSHSNLSNSFHFDIKTTGNITYIDFQLRPKDAYLLYMPGETWDWRDRDSAGSIKDLDDSKADVTVVPLLELTVNSVPDQSAVRDYGIGISGNKALVPLSPDQDYGAPVAMRGRMFYPESAPLDISADAMLIWMISVTTDEKRDLIALRARNGLYVHADNESNGTLVADSSATGDWVNFTLRDVSETTIALKAHNGLYVRADDGHGGTLIANSTAVGDWEKFELVEVDTHNVTLKAHNGRYVRADIANGTLVADSRAIGEWETFVRIDQGDTVDSDTITYGHYYEDFMLTGFSVEENSGSDVGLFYSADKNETLEAGFVLAYDFVRNATTRVADMPSDLIEHNVTVNSTIRSYAHQDEALMAVTSEMTPDAIQSLPKDIFIPILAAFEDRFTRRDMDDLLSASGTTYAIDLRSEPLISTKTMKMTWYNTSSSESLELESIMTEMQDWGQTQGIDTYNQETMMSVVLAWNVGETTVTSIGSDMTDFDYPEALDVLNKIKEYKLIDGLAFITESITRFGRAYYIIKFCGIKVTAGSSGWKLSLKVARTLSKIEPGFLKVIGRVTKAIETIGWVIEIGMAYYSFFAIASESDWSLKGLWVGYLYMKITLIFAFILYAIGQIPIVGWIIVALITLSDILTMLFCGQGWMAMLIEEIVDAFLDVDPRTEVVGLDMKDSSLKIDDSDNNGLDVGDWIEFTSTVTGTVKRTEHGTTADLNFSYVKPSYKLGFDVGGYTTNSSLNTTRYDGTHKVETYDLGLKLWPRSGVNLPMLVQLVADYLTFYDDCWWLFGWHCDRVGQTGSSTSDLTTLYFDVFPATISEFVRWRGMTPLDNDHDGLTYTEERSNSTSPWSFDTDGDGLSDKYELDIGTNPRDADADRDGLNDKLELLYNTNHSFWDTDGDGLSDYMETNGWVITVNYSGFVFNTTVHADPLRPDADGDGVEDEMEYFSFLNPLSKDTDGDGVMDVAAPKYYTQFNFTTKWGSKGNETGNFTHPPERISIDEDGYVYVAEFQTPPRTEYQLSLGPARIQKFDANGTYITQWSVDVMTDLAVGNGFVYVTNTNGSHLMENQSIMKFDADGMFLKSWTRAYWIPWSVDVGPKGNIFVLDGSYLLIFDPDGGFIKEWYAGDVHWDRPMMAVDSLGYVWAMDYTRDLLWVSNETWVAKFDLKTLLQYPESVAVDSGRFVYIADTGNHRILKFTPDIRFIKQLGYEGTGDGEFEWPSDVAVYEPFRLLRLAKNYNLGNTGTWGYVGDVYVVDSGNYRIQKFAMETLLPDILKDSDGDGLTDLNETIGWNVTFTNATGTYTIQASSEPLMIDSDLEGLTDYGEFKQSSNPRDVDTDDDGLTDLVEYEFGTNILHYDTDGEGLDDGTEITFGSNPLLPDTDYDGLSDYEEFYLSINFPYYAGLNFTTDPTKPDTDGEGLTDSQEINFSDPLLLDTDGDLLNDSEEWEWGTDPWNPDTDGDGLIDGHEDFFETNLTNPDSDNDGVNDSEEIDKHLDPLLNDTDGDGLLDGDELNKSLNPLSKDSDGDGIPDSEDFDSFISFEGHVYLAYDPDPDTDEFAEQFNASLNYTYLHVVSLDELLTDHKDAPYIVLVGRPDAANGTVGALIHDLLVDSGDILDQMLESDSYRLAVRYGVWNSTQTIIMLSYPYPRDHYRVLNILKGRMVTILPDSATVVYFTPHDFFEINTIDTLKETDSVIAAALNEPVTFYVQMKRYNDSTIPFALTQASGLTGDDEAVGRYLKIEVSESVQNETSSNLTGATITIYYTAADLDRTGDGDADDDEDIDEGTLKMYWYDETQGRWTELSTSMPWVLGLGVNTTNVELFGNSYEGYVWADVLHFSTYGLAGQIGQPPTTRRGHGGYVQRDSDNDSWSDIKELIEGTDPYNPDTDGDGIIDSLDTYPLDPALPVQPAVTPSPALPPSATPIMTPAPETTPTSTEKPEATSKPWLRIPGFEAILLLLAVGFVVVIDYLNRLKRKRL